MRRLRILIFPLLLFCLSLIIFLFFPDFLESFSPNEDALPNKILYYFSHIFLWLTAASVFNRLVSIFFWDGIVSKSIQGTVPRLLIDFFALIVYLLVITGLLGYIFKVSLTGFWATSSVAALIVGFALRNMILDLFTGLAVNIERPYQIGDWLQVHNNDESTKVIGEVIDINWRATRLKTEERRIVIIPNSLMTSFVVTNYTYTDKRIRDETIIYLDYSIPVDRARRIMMAAAKQVVKTDGFFEDPEPKVIPSYTTERGVEYLVRYWIEPWKGIFPAEARGKINSGILEALKISGITPAFPKEEIFFSKLVAQEHDSKSLEFRKNLLHNIELFQSFEELELNDLAEKIEGQHYSLGDTLINVGDPGDSMFVLAEGLVNVYINSDNGGQHKVADISPGKFFGEMSLLTGEPRSATIKAATNVLVYEVKKLHIEGFLKDRPEIINQIGEIVAQRQLSTTTEMEKLKMSASTGYKESFSEQIASKIRSFFIGFGGDYIEQ